MSSDRWSRVEYRRQIAWPERIKREWPFLEPLLATAPSRRVLDLGCGTGEHSRHLGIHGFEVVGIDSSREMIEMASGQPVPASVRFINADIADLGAIELATAGGALCVGNTLPHLADEDLRRFAQGIAAALIPMAPLILQLLNYDRIRTRNIRHLPLNFQHLEEGGELVYLRLLEPKSDGTVIFSPTTLRHRPDRDPPVEVVHTRSVKLHAWTWVELWDVFGAAGFGQFQLFGGFDGRAFDPTESEDVIAVLRR
jgi:SAM-dependent methyltransferase